MMTLENIDWTFYTLLYIIFNIENYDITVDSADTLNNLYKTHVFSYADNLTIEKFMKLREYTTYIIENNVKNIDINVFNFAILKYQDIKSLDDKEQQKNINIYNLLLDYVSKNKENIVWTSKNHKRQKKFEITDYNNENIDILTIELEMIRNFMRSTHD